MRQALPAVGAGTAPPPSPTGPAASAVAPSTAPAASAAETAAAPSRATAPAGAVAAVGGAAALPMAGGGAALVAELRPSALTALASSWRLLTCLVPWAAGAAAVAADAAPQGTPADRRAPERPLALHSTVAAAAVTQRPARLWVAGLVADAVDAAVRAEATGAGKGGAGRGGDGGLALLASAGEGGDAGGNDAVGSEEP